MNPDNWESVDSIDTSSGVMVSNLPLLFANGNITSLQHMTLTELEVFLPFMVKCSVGEDLKVAWSQLPKPVWWPSRLPFRPPSCSTPSTTKTFMVRLIERCYAFHGCQYLLQFCLSLRQMEPTLGYRFTDNRDGTTSMYHGSTGKLLVTFRNENKDYDKAALKPKNQLSSQKKLLPSSSLQSSTKNGVMVRPPISDVFLCDKCDDEFSSLREVQTHEKGCKGNGPQMMKLPSPEPEYPEEEQESEDQVPFLSYFGLQPGEHTGIAPYKSPRKRQPTPLKKPLLQQSYMRYDSIDVASPLGRYILSNCKYGGKLQMPQQQVLRYEKYVFASPEPDHMSTREMRDRSANRWIVVWRPRRDEQPWTHLYTFTSDQKKERLITLQTGLDKRSRKLLTKCIPARVKLKRLAKRTIDRATRLGGRSAPCIDLTSEDDPSSCATPRFFVPASNDAHTVVPVPFPPHQSIDLASRDPLSLDTVNNSSAYPDHCSSSSSSSSSASSQTGLPQTQVDKHENNLISRVPTIENGNCLSVHEDYINNEFNLRKLNSYGVKVSNICSDSSVSSKNRVNSSCLESKNNRLGTLSNDSLVNIKNSSQCSTPSPVLPKVPSSKHVPSSAASLVKGSPYHAVYITESSSSPAKAIEVIDLSSDEEDASQNGELLGRSDYPPVGRDSANNRSHARSKNGYSHWSYDECSKRGRDQSHSMTNGTTPHSVPPQPSPESHCCSPTSLHFSISDHSLDGQSVVSLPLCFVPADTTSLDQLLNTHSYARSFFHVTESQDGAFLGSEVVPKITLDGRGSMKAPLQIDEDISFNFRVREPPPNFKGSPNRTVVEDEESFNHSYSKNLFLHLADRVNKGLIYFTSFVKSSLYSNLKDGFKSYIGIALEDLEATTPPSSLPTKNIKTETLLPEAEARQSKRSKSREINLLLKDECRELKRRGIDVLDYLEDNERQSRKMTTRCAAEKKLANLNSLNTRRSKFLILPPKKKRTTKNHTRTRIEGTCKKERGRKKSLARDVATGETEVVSEETRVSSRETLAAPEERLVAPEKTRVISEETDDEKVARLINPASLSTSTSDSQFAFRDHHPHTKKNGSFYSHWWSVDENFNEFTVEKPHLNHNFKRPKLKRELANLAQDECKELKDLGFHPSDIVGSCQSTMDVLHHSDEEASVNSSPAVKKPMSLISFKGESGKKRHVHEPSVAPQGNKRLSLELSKLMMDEWKELRASGSHPSQLSNFLSIGRSSRYGVSRKGKPRRLYEWNDNNDDFNRFSLARSSRAQERTATTMEIQNPRKAHREMIKTENGMCVLNYTVTNFM